ncbi:MAG: hypothetical protein ACPMAQ_11460 [Phycisphaerae bacterium]
MSHLRRSPALHGEPFDRRLAGRGPVCGMTIRRPDPLIRQDPARTMW